MTWIDWLLVVVPVLGLAALALRTRRYVRGVADFIAAGRCAGRYLLANAKGEAGSGVTNTVSWFEVLMVAGFVTSFWGSLSVPVGLIVGITGFVVYRYRETRALTIAQFFEMRYSRRFRLFMGGLAFLAGVLNYGIFPAVSARFFIYFLALPETVSLGPWAVPTFVLLMAGYMSISVGLILFGGQVTLIVTDCVEGLLSHVIYIVIIVALLYLVGWERIVDVLTGLLPGGTGGSGHADVTTAAAHLAATMPTTAPATLPAGDMAARVIEIPQNYSPVNPFDAWKVSDFNPTYVLLGMVGSVYGVMSWQGGHGFNSAARTPHEGRMGNILSRWREYARTLVLVVLVICAMAFLRHPDFTTRAAPVKAEVARIQQPGEAKPQTPGKDTPGAILPAATATAPATQTATTASATPETHQGKPEYQTWEIGSAKWANDKDNVPQLQRQQVTSVTLRHMLPAGVMGLFMLVMVLGLFAGDGNHLISWSSILIQDVIVPLWGKELTAETHLKLLRLSVVLVAGFAFLFSALVPLKVPIWMWWAITGAIYNGGAGAVIIGGLYWRKGTTTAAWVAMILGSSFSFIAILLNYFWKDLLAVLGPTALGRMLPEKMWGNSQWHGFLAMILAAGSYVLVSWLTCRKEFDMDWLLKRGKYRVGEDHANAPAGPKPTLIQRLIGIDSTFSRIDKIVAGFIFWWSMFLVGTCAAMVIWHYGIGARWPELRLGAREWTQYWAIFGLGLPFIFAAITLVWFGIGGIIDLRAFFQTLETMRRDTHDDGSVQKGAATETVVEDKVEVGE